MNNDAYSAAQDLLGSLSSYATTGGGIRTDRTSIEPPALDISANGALSWLLFDPPEPPLTAAVPDDGGDRRGLLWVGVGAVAAGGATAAVILASGDEPIPDEPTTVEPEPGGTITVGPIP